MQAQSINYISGLSYPSDTTSEPNRPRNLVLLGSTGSIGRSTLDVVASNPNAFRVLALAGGKNVKLLAEQAEAWRPSYLAVQDDQARQELLPLLRYQPEVLSGQEGYVSLAALPEADLVLSAQVGAAGLRGTLSAVRAGKLVALANKESLVLAGDLIRAECGRSKACILPVDSEHNAIFQCLGLQSSQINHSDAVQKDCSGLRRLILTASGGPFRGKSREFMEKAGKREALAHPTWSMGAKITIDSASLMNKGLEIIEASHLFGLPDRLIDVVVHPQSLIHSMVEFEDNSILAQLGPPDMRVPIASCLGWPGRMPNRSSGLNLLGLPPLTFEAPDASNFPALNLCRAALNGGNGLSVALNAANEVAVILFMADKIGFCGISRLVAAVLEKWDQRGAPQSLEEILELDEKARRLALELSKTT
ncbi:MAG: 1-deoxy-D-xylulose-5-phosphate reductoisomerase [Deltaproteobacteria bacterium]|jgi:1-deoxy-D-xylulose-5-phosphate reductoisomerase|nr:1-deoxy-D-xylulose-5-phosphate reductoisomerase [Deltaproteobacteria bacterium]